jgi:regulator of replication initiation timing
MMLAGRLFLIVLLAIGALTADAQRRRDPLTEAESDQIRQATVEPPKRIKLMLTFATARLTAIDQIRANPNLQKEQTTQIHDLLEDFASIVDELDDNVTMFDERNEDLRKALKTVVESNTDWQLRLRALRETSGNNLKDYEFVLQDATESVTESAASTRETLQNQNARFGKSKDKDKPKLPPAQER